MPGPLADAAVVAVTRQEAKYCNYTLQVFGGERVAVLWKARNGEVAGLTRRRMGWALF